MWSGNDEPVGTRSILSPKKIAERTAPEAKVCLEGEECGEASAAAPAEEVAATPEDLYNGKCSSCHGAGVLGAPVPGKADHTPGGQLLVVGSLLLMLNVAKFTKDKKNF